MKKYIKKKTVIRVEYEIANDFKCKNSGVAWHDALNIAKGSYFGIIVRYSLIGLFDLKAVYLENIWWISWCWVFNILVKGFQTSDNKLSWVYVFHTG